MGIWHIIDNIYLGDKFGAKDKYHLINLDIRRVVNLAGFKCDDVFPNLEYINLRLEDKINGILPIDESLTFIEKSDDNILIHCAGAHSRSPAIICAYLIKHKQFTLDQCIKLIIEKRGIIHINDGFIDQLKKYQKLTLK
jgi:protein-tyrosine phosphatase